MKRALLTLLLLTGLATGAAAQSATFDLATFTVPGGWQRVEQAGFLELQSPRSSAHPASYCQIYLFPSHPGDADAAANFAAEWTRLIAQPFGTSARPQVQTKQTPDGWTAVSGGVRVIQRGLPVDAILFTVTGFGRVMSVVINASGTDYAADVQGFWSQLHFQATPGGSVAAAPTPGPGAAAAAPGAPAPAPAAIGASASNGTISYTIPQGWTGRAYPDGGIVYGSPMFNNGERCQISVFPVKASSGNLADDARRAFADIFQTDPLQNNAYPYPTATLQRGTAAQGWDYFVIQRSIHGRVGEYGSLLGVSVLAAQVGSQVAIITHTGKDPEVSMCFGEIVHDEWPRFFHGIQIRGAAAPAQEQSVTQRLAGQWTTATGSVGLHYTFTSSGRYASTGAAMTTTRLNSSEVLETTNAYFGDGRFTITGNVLTLTRDSDHVASRNWFRLEQQSKDGGATWTDRLCLLGETVGEVCYARDR